MRPLLKILRPVDWFIAGYELLMVLSAVVFSSRINNYTMVILRHGAALAVVVAIRWLAVKHPKKYGSNTI